MLETMTIFAVIKQPGPNSDKLASSVEDTYPQKHYDLGDGSWLIAESGTASDLTTKLGITPEGLNGSALVIEVASYYGRANPAIWTWIKTNWEAKGG
jgi:hypothetical protein